MRRRLHPVLLLLLLTALCAGVIALVAHFRARFQSRLEMLARLPAKNAVLFHIDFAALRQAGLLAILEGSDPFQEPEYRAFREGSGFDYLRDLDWVLAAVGPEGAYFLLRGRFDWNALTAYVTQQGGACYNTLCRVPGSTPERRISYCPLQPNLMALAVASDEYAATYLLNRNPGLRPAVWPERPVWVFVPAARLQQLDALPASARLLAQALEATEGLLLALGSRAGQLEISLEASCRTAPDAAALAGQLRRLTALLGQTIAAENKPPDPRDLSGVLTAGLFDSRERTVTGRWPVPRAFLEGLAGGAR